MKNINMHQLAQMEAVTHSSPMPRDILELLHTPYYSQSRREYVPMGELTLPHFIRVLAARGYPSGDQVKAANGASGWTPERRAKMSQMMKARHKAAA